MDYNEMPGVNKSTLWEMRKSPLHYWHLVHDTPREDTRAMKLGRAAHMLMLQPKEFENAYATAPKCDRRTSAGKEIWAKLAETGKEILSEEDMDMLQAMETEYRKTCTPLLAKYPPTATETGLTWTDDETGVECKGRPDILTQDYIIDYKTTTDAGTDAFRREALRYGYDLQAAMYTEAARANGYSPKGFIFIAQEKNAPYLINILYAGDAFLDRGMWIMRDLLRKYKACMKSGIWPGYGENELILNEWEAMDE